MDLEYLLSNAGRFFYELRKNFPEDEKPVKYFVCEEQVVVLSNKKLYIFYVGVIIDYKFEKLENIEITKKENGIEVELMNKNFQLIFKDDELETFVKYFNKYKD